MGYKKPNRFIKSKSSDSSSLVSAFSDFEKDDDDPLSIKRLSLRSFGFIFAFLTFLLPSVSILIGRPFSKGNEVIFNQDFKKDGS